jgi:hypothetical protein
MDRTVIDTGWAVTACITGDPAGAVAVLDAIADGRLVSAIENTPPMLAVWTAVAACHVAMMIERFAESTQAFEAGWSRAQEAGAPPLITYMGIGYADVQCRQGRLADARQLVSSIEEANDGLRAGLSAVALLPEALVALETGDSPSAAAACDLLDRTLIQNFAEYYPYHGYGY